MGDDNGIIDVVCGCWVVDCYHLIARNDLFLDLIVLALIGLAIFGLY